MSGGVVVGVVIVVVVSVVVVVVAVVAVVVVAVAVVVVDTVRPIVVLRDASAVGIERCSGHCVGSRSLSVRSRFALTTTVFVVNCDHETTISHVCETTTFCGGRRAGVVWRAVVMGSSVAKLKRVCLFSSWRGVREFASARRLAFSTSCSQLSQHESRCAQRRVVA